MADITIFTILMDKSSKDNWVAWGKGSGEAQKWNLNFLIHYFSTRLYYLIFRNDKVFES